jgi:hypothetical protein
MPRLARMLLGVASAAVLAVLAPRAAADNAGFAIAPRNAAIAIDSRGISALLEGEQGMVLRPVVEALAGPDAMATFDKLSKRTTVQGQALTRELLAGRVAFFVPEGPAASNWLIGFQSDDKRCAHLLQMFGAKMVLPGRYESAGEQLVMRRVGGWLLVAPIGDEGRAAIDAAAQRVPVEDPANSLIGDPNIQQLLASDSPVRLFMRHNQPLGGATTVTVRPADRGLRAEISGRYDSPPLMIPAGRDKLDPHLVRAFEDRAVLMISNPADGRATAGESFWVALLPELLPSPAMRSNLAGERVFVVGLSEAHAMPSVACAWRIEDAEQAEVDQDHFMRALCCGLTRSIEIPRPASPGKPDAGPAGSAQPKVPAPPEIAPRAVDDRAPGRRECPELGRFADRYLGEPFKLGDAMLCWKTVATPCGGWQVYSSDPEWLDAVVQGLGADSCSEEPKFEASGIGFCDGPRAAAMLRRWQPLVVPRGNDRVARGLGAIAELLERMGRIRFRYEMPAAASVEAVVEIEPLGRLLAPVKRENPISPTNPK